MSITQKYECQHFPDTDYMVVSETDFGVDVTACEWDDHSDELASSCVFISMEDVKRMIKQLQEVVDGKS